MKKLFFTIAFLFATVFTFAQDVYVQGYTRSNGTYVQGYYRTASNTTRNDNYSTIGNTNPYTGIAGTKPADSYTSTASYSRSTYSAPTYSSPSRNSTTYSTPSYSRPSYSSSSTYSTPTPVYTGSRGGQYYINSNGNKTYIRR